MLLPFAANVNFMVLAFLCGCRSFKAAAPEFHTNALPLSHPV